MRMKWRTGLWVIFLCALPACYGGSSIVHQFDLKPDYRPSPWKKIAVLPFSGDQRFTRVAAEWFAHHLQKQSHFSIVTPTFAEIEIQKLGISSNEDKLSPEEARRAARSLGADALFLGQVEAQFRSRSPAKVSIQLIDLEREEPVAASTVGYPSILLKWANYHEYVAYATDKAGEMFLKLLEDLALGKWVSPSIDPYDTSQDAPSHEL